MTLLIDGNPEELAQFLNLFANDTDDTTGDDTGTNDTDDDVNVNKRLAAEFTELMKRYPAIKYFKIIGTKVDDDADGEKS